MTKRPALNLAELTAEAATPMQEASQRSARVSEPAPKPTAAVAETGAAANAVTKTANLKGLAFKVPPAFHKRFREQAASAELKLNELLFEALDAWEERQKTRKL